MVDVEMGTVRFIMVLQGIECPQICFIVAKGSTFLVVFHPCSVSCGCLQHPWLGVQVLCLCSIFAFMVWL